MKETNKMLDGRQTDLWNLIVGTPYQHNKHLMFRLELAFGDQDNKLITRVQYRFEL